MTEIPQEPVYLHMPVNVLEVETEGDESDPEGYRARTVKVGPMIGASALGATVYDLEPGESICPYHYEFGNEEWLIVLEGRPTLRDEENEEYELNRWDVALFAEGPEGAHKLTNNTKEPVRLMIMSTKNEPSLAVYPDSNKVGVWSGPGEKIGLFRIDDAVDYWEGEAEIPAKPSDEAPEED